jgi:hypothetical protein
MQIHGLFQVGAAERQMRLFSLLSTSRTRKREENVNNNARVTRQEGLRQKYEEMGERRTRGTGMEGLGQTVWCWNERFMSD